MGRARLELNKGDVVKSKDKRIHDNLWNVIKVDSLIARIENQTTGKVINYGLAVMKDFFTIHRVKDS